VALIVLLPWWKAPDPETGRAGLVSYAPSALTTELRAIAAPGDRLLAPQPWGSWFEHAIPGLPVYVDSRFELFGEDVWDEYVGLVNLGEGWQDLLDRRGVSVVVIDPERTAGLGEHLAVEPGWRRAYADDLGSIFVRSER